MRPVFKVATNFSNIFENFSVRRYFQCNMSLLSDDSNDSSNDYFDSIKKIQKFIPVLHAKLHKGQCGRIGVIGGSFEYTGAPYFAAISSLKLGADLAHVFCCREAGPVIKTYSPEVMVHPILDCNDVVKQIAPWLERLHVLVIGPGMGRNPGVLKNVADIINHCKKTVRPTLPIIIDADGLHLITENTSVLKGYPGPIVLTPNVVEFTRLSVKLSESNSLKVASFFNAILLQKGVIDVITNGMHINRNPPVDMTLTCDMPGSNRRCGGQGDILAGCIGTFIAWLQIHFNSGHSVDFSKSENEDREPGKVDFFFNNLELYSLAVYGGCVITRTCSKLAFEKHGRSMTASDMILCIEKAFKTHFDS